MNGTEPTDSQHGPTGRRSNPATVSASHILATSRATAFSSWMRFSGSRRSCGGIIVGCGPFVPVVFRLARAIHDSGWVCAASSSGTMCYTRNSGGCSKRTSRCEPRAGEHTMKVISHAPHTLWRNGRRSHISVVTRGWRQLHRDGTAALRVERRDFRPRSRRRSSTARAR